MLKKMLLPALAGAILIVLLVYGWYFTSSEQQQSVAALEAAALSADSSQQRQRAASELIGHGAPAKEAMQRVLRRSNSPDVRRMPLDRQPAVS